MVTMTPFNFDLVKRVSNCSGKFQTNSNVEKSKILSFFDILYASPSKFIVKWNALDELNTDLFLPLNKHSLPFLDYVDESFFSSKGNVVQEKAGLPLQDFQITKRRTNDSSRFYGKQTSVLQKALSTVPTYVVKNGLDEIVLTKTKQSQRAGSILKSVAHNYNGGGDSESTLRPQVGFFFMNRFDAELYLQEIATSDIDGTETVGLSIHCVGLDSAYNTMREYHPGIDFRIVPNLQEVKNLLTTNPGKSSLLIFDERQQQLRFRSRSANLIPALGKVGHFLSPGSSYLQNNEYFKGVPVYIVQLQKYSPNLFCSQTSRFFSLFDTVYGGLVNQLFGCRQNWILQGSLNEVKGSEQISNYIFFEKSVALDFIKSNKSKTIRYAGSRSPKLSSVIRKSKIYVSNLEDFLESWENNIASQFFISENADSKTLYSSKQTFFIPPKANYEEMQDFLENKSTNKVVQLTTEVVQTIGLKYNILKDFIGVLFSVSYA